MHERVRRHLHPDVQQALLLAKRASGKKPVLRRVDYLPQGTHARLQRPERLDQPYEIQYLRGQERFLDHLLTHEIGHIIRLHQVPAPERLTAVVTPEARQRAGRQIIDELAPFLEAGLPENLVAELFMDWHQNVATQLANFPADLRIEAWMFDRFPGLRAIQQRSLLREVGRSYPLLDPAVRLLTPPTIYRPTMAMNAAQASHVSTLYRHPELLAPFAQHGLVEVGRRLAQFVFDAPDEGHRSDMAATHRWAEELGTAGWLEWT